MKNKLIVIGALAAFLALPSAQASKKGKPKVVFSGKNGVVEKLTNNKTRLKISPESLLKFQNRSERLTKETLELKEKDVKAIEKAPTESAKDALLTNILVREAYPKAEKGVKEENITREEGIQRDAERISENYSELNPKSKSAVDALLKKLSKEDIDSNAFNELSGITSIISQGRKFTGSAKEAIEAMVEVIQKNPNMRTADLIDLVAKTKNLSRKELADLIVKCRA